MTEEEFVQRLEMELEGWRRESLVTDQQAGAIIARYGEPAVGRNRGKIGGLFGFIGAMLIGIGVILFFASNWEEIPGVVKLLMILLSVLVSQYAGYRLRFEV